MIFSHFFDVDVLDVASPKILPPQEIFKRYGLEGQNRDPKEKAYKFQTIIY
jgi:hypothetical protein